LRSVTCVSADEIGDARVALGAGDDRLVLTAQTRDQFWFTTGVTAGPGDDRVRLGDAGEVSGGAGDDRVDGSPYYDVLRGGPGRDVLRGGGHGDYADGGAGDDVLRGGAGDDMLLGGGHGGADVLDGGAGGDVLEDGDLSTDAGPDVLTGGPGEDEAGSYRDRDVPVSIDLAAGRAGQDGEGDVVRGIERIFGGRAGDLIAGSDGPDWIDGLGGDDSIDARAGDDLVQVDGLDAADTGAGDDVLRVFSDHAGSAACGDGDDVVRLVVTWDPRADRPGPLVAGDCEELRAATSAALAPVPVRADGALVFTVRAVKRAGIGLSVGASTAAIAPGAVAIPSAAPAGTLLRAVVVPVHGAVYPWRFAAP
jgi:Ca2+-binding RTX toxin-like protein